MPRLTDKNEIRSLLQRDAHWCVYALGDLTDRMFAKCQWFASASATAAGGTTPDLTLVFHDYGTSILFAHGSDSIREALDHVSWPVHLQVQQDGLDEVARHANVTSLKAMLRMAAEHTRAADQSAAARSAKAENTDRSEPDFGERVQHLGVNDVAALRRLYADGDTTGESPDFFFDAMVPDGVFFGVYEGSDLVAAAGTHLFSPDENAAAIGNVYTRRDRRGRGLGRAVTAAVLHGLRHLKTIGLNVRQDNLPAIRVYESLGFVRHCGFIEAIATHRR